MQIMMLPFYWLLLTLIVILTLDFIICSASYATTIT